MAEVGQLEAWAGLERLSSPGRDHAQVHFAFEELQVAELAAELATEFAVDLATDLAAVVAADLAIDLATVVAVDAFVVVEFVVADNYAIGVVAIGVVDIDDDTVATGAIVVEATFDFVVVVAIVDVV